jgi:hypothetical protein
MKARGLPEVDDHLKRQYRDGWEPSLA